MTSTDSGKLFTPPPTLMPALSSAVEHFREDLPALLAPPLGTGLRLRKEFALARTTGYTELPRTFLRQLPYALWISGEPSLMSTDGALVNLYWDKILPEAIRGTQRHIKRWLDPIFFTYCSWFNAADVEFLDFAVRFRRILGSMTDRYSARLREWQDRYDFFSVDQAPATLARFLFKGADTSLAERRHLLAMNQGFAGTGLGGAILLAELSLLRKNTPGIVEFQNVLDWIADLPADLVRTAFRIPVASALLEPWGNRPPDPETKQLLQDFLLESYKDPRLPGTSNTWWHGVPESAISVLRGWLAGDTLNVFMHVLRRTADETWAYRQKIWMSYYAQGCIEDAWLALGKKAATQARLLAGPGPALNFGTLDGARKPTQSVLLFRLGDLLLVEWSHDGSLRAYKRDDPQAPRLYQSGYDASELRGSRSLDFHNGENKTPELRHAGSPHGSWQRTARDFIRMHTGVYLPDHEILR